MELQIIDQRPLLGKNIAVYGTNEEPFFLAKDVAEWIDYSKSGNGSYNITQMVSTIDDEEKLVSTMLVAGQNRNVIFITEDGLYEVLMQSRKPIAKELKKGIKHILKEIRLNGGYIATHSTDTPEMIMARGLQVAMQTIENVKLQNERLQIENSKMKTRSDFVNIVFDSDKLLTGSKVCKLLNLPYGNKTLYKILREKGIFFKNGNEPKQSYVDRGYFRMKEIVVNDIIKTQTLFTQKGLGFIAKTLEIVVEPIKQVKTI